MMSERIPLNSVPSPAMCYQHLQILNGKHVVCAMLTAECTEPTVLAVLYGSVSRETMMPPDLRTPDACQ